MQFGNELLRSDLLEGRVVLVVGGGPAPDGLGARIKRWEDPVALEGYQAEQMARDLYAKEGRLDACVVDLASVFSQGGTQGLALAMDTAWVVTRGVALGAMIEASSGTVVLIAPRADAGPSAMAAQAAVENLARTLSVEWARFDIRTVAICPRVGATKDEIRTLVAWLCSDSGTYVTGTRLEPGRLAP
jgi:NAD(P)-dependent dehydrogenase (short-subunit alcohol dehydrogenase family)